MFSEEELNAFYEGKRSGYENEEYDNPHMKFVNTGLNGAAEIAEGHLHDQYKRGFAWGKAQKEEEQ